MSLVGDYENGYVESKRHLIREYKNLVNHVAPLISDDTVVSMLNITFKKSLKRHDYGPYIERLKELQISLYCKLLQDPTIERALDKLTTVANLSKISSSSQKHALDIAFTMRAKDAMENLGPWKPVVDDVTKELYWWNTETNATQRKDPRSEPSIFYPPPLFYSELEDFEIL